jgi:TolA-binding protein
MAEAKQDIWSKLADRSEQMIGRITDLPGAKGLMESVQSLRERMDDLQKRVRGLEHLEKRLVALEKRVKVLEGGGASRAAPKKATRTKSSVGSASRQPRTTPKSSAPES